VFATKWTRLSVPSTVDLVVHSMLDEIVYDPTHLET
jgi:hypothetical protein